MGAAATYDPSKVIITYGTTPVVGLAEGDAITVETNTGWTKKVGMAGAVARARKADPTGTIKLKLLATSSSNDVFTVAHKADQITGAGKLPLFIKDLSGRTLAFASEAWIEAVPSVALGAEVGDREWTFCGADVEILVGGND